jgi:hypothetical protein
MYKEVKWTLESEVLTTCMINNWLVGQWSLFIVQIKNLVWMVNLTMHVYHMDRYLPWISRVSRYLFWIYRVSSLLPIDIRVDKCRPVWSRVYRYLHEISWVGRSPLVRSQVCRYLLWSIGIYFDFLVSVAPGPLGLGSIGLILSLLRSIGICLRFLGAVGVDLSML